MRARLLMKERFVLAEDRFAEIVVWSVPMPVHGCTHAFKYRLALVVNEVCVLRYDNESGKGDHKHLGETQAAYVFVSLDRLLEDFRRDVDKWRPQ
ncbi:MAG: hypothetical protein EPN26_14915 [Rhodospirillales bacterium]|nr:MAG: hypothetical protein EPN26_14915 [Rhodospirillales bacterium]